MLEILSTSLLDENKDAGVGRWERESVASIPLPSVLVLLLSSLSLSSIALLTTLECTTPTYIIPQYTILNHIASKHTNSKCTTLEGLLSSVPLYYS